MSPPKKSRAPKASTPPPEALHLSKAYRIDLEVLLAAFQGTSSRFWPSLRRFQARFRGLDWPRTARLLELSRTASCPTWHSGHIRVIDQILVERYVELTLGFRCGMLPQKAQPKAIRPAKPKEIEPAKPKDIKPVTPKDIETSPPPVPARERDAAADVLARVPCTNQIDHMHRLASFLTRSKKEEDRCVVSAPISVSPQTKESPWKSHHAASLLSAARRHINALTPVQVNQQWCILVVAFQHNEVHVFGPEEMYEPMVRLRTVHYQVLYSLLRVIDWAAGPAECLQTPSLAPETEIAVVFHHMIDFDEGHNFVQAQRLMFRIYESGIPETLVTKTRFCRPQSSH
ncbi:hypothetical protein GQ53DRAFT_818770 [Thozetella sp. PMI_491]|nr:hypothetical protein GQ53DRAFT_818770 [Thozetella sp. PMI_491]